MNTPKFILVAIALFFTLSSHSKEPSSPQLLTIEQFIAAFNAHDSGAMAELVTDDVTWLSIAGDRVATEAKSKSELVSGMDAYFKSCPTCQAAVSATISTPTRVSAVEIASWREKTEPRSQQSLSVYEFSNGLIHRVYYFPSEK